MPLTSLPVELQLRVMHFLDPVSYIRFTVTSHHFLSLREDEVMKEALLECEIDWPDDFIDRGLLPCYGCLKLVDIDDLVMADSLALYGDPRENTYNRDQDKWIPFAGAGPLADERRCKACDDKRGGEFSEYAESLEASIHRDEANDALELYTELGGGYERATGDWSMWQDYLHESANESEYGSDSEPYDESEDEPEYDSK